LQIFIRAFKQEKSLEVWARNSDEEQFKLLTKYPFCESSGQLGPKRKMGDLQTPEGIYFIDRFNPASNYHLSLGINYPNDNDKVLGEKNNLGGDIFIHGDCVTVGCIPITDDKIKELYLLCVEAKTDGQLKIPVHIYPFNLTKANLDRYKSNPNYNFWETLKPKFDLFEKNKSL
jgi:murein L,D-transpeptidase YafK